MVLGPLALDTRTLGTQTQVFDPLCLPPTYLSTTLPDLLVNTYDASKVLNEILCSFDALGIFFLGNQPVLSCLRKLLVHQMIMSFHLRLLMHLMF